jgi:hypothetical protein
MWVWRLLCFGHGLEAAAERQLATLPTANYHMSSAGGTGNCGFEMGCHQPGVEV